MNANTLMQIFPVGRAVMGSFSEPQTKDQNGNPLVIKTGPDAGKPTQRYFFAVAIPKSPPGSPGVNPSTGAPDPASPHNHWSCTPWGQKIWAAGWAAWPNGQCQAPTFAWKIGDGDSQVPNQNGRKNANTEGMPGHWVVHFSSTYAVKTFDAKGTHAVDPKSIKLGHYVEVYGSVLSNENAQKPGMYINHVMVAHAGFGPEITRGPDPSSVGFGNTALPAGATAAPQSAMQPPAGQPGAAPPAPAPAAVAPPVAAAPAAPAVAAPAPTSVQPHAGYMVPAAAAPAPAGPVWKGPPAGYAAHKANGWTDDQLRTAGYIA